jgi:hypothetical protein
MHCAKMSELLGTVPTLANRHCARMYELQGIVPKMYVC